MDRTDLFKGYQRLENEFKLRGIVELVGTLAPFFDHPRGNTLKYISALEALPNVRPSAIDLDQDRLKIGTGSDLTFLQKEILHKALFDLCPWRKGPFDLFGLDLDTEWQSFIKWNRLVSKISLLKNRRVLDIGSSNGYYMLRMASHKPRMVLGLEPQHSFYFQFQALQHYLGVDNLFSLPISFDAMPVTEKAFDTVFCMGVLYHRRSPMDMLRKIHDMMEEKGELIVENLVLNNHDDLCLFPEDRYAKMRNVFFIPSIKVMESWLKRSGFDNIRCIDISLTTLEEQRKTPWIQTESLDDFLHPHDRTLTVEGYPAPVRAVFVARA